MGRRIDGIFSSYVNDIEYGAVEVGKIFEGPKGTKLLGGFKLGKTLHDILICLKS